MNTVILNKFDGGIAEDLRTHNTDESEYSLNFDIFRNPHKLTPFPDSVQCSLTGGQSMNDVQLNDVNFNSQYIVATGYESNVSTKASFYLADATNSIFTKDLTTALADYVSGSLVFYKGNLYCLTLTGGNYTLNKYDGFAITSIGTITLSTTLKARPFVHPEDNVLYIVQGSIISSYDGTTLTSYSSILPTGIFVVGLTQYGNYLAIATTTASGNKAYTYLWGRDGTLNTLQGQIDFGEDEIIFIQNLDNILFAFTAPNGYYNTVSNKRLTVKAYSGGAVQTIKVIDSDDFLGTTYLSGIPRWFPLVSNGKIYFCPTATTSAMVSLSPNSIYVFGKNGDGKYVLAKDRYISNGDTGANTPLFISGLSKIGDIVYCAYSLAAFGNVKLTVSNLSSPTYVANSIYRTTINPNMLIDDRYKNKQLDWVRISYTGASSGITALKYSVDGSSMTSIISDSNTAGEKVTEASAESTGKSFMAGREFQFQIESTGGSQIKEIAYGYTILPTT